MPDRYGETDPTDLDATPSARALAIVDCGLCDDDGYRGHVICDHVNRTETASRGHDLIQAELEKIRQRKANAVRENRP